MERVAARAFRDAWFMAGALASTPITSQSGRSSASARTWRPSPVPRSTATALWAAARSVS